MQPMSNDAYKRNTASDQRAEKKVRPRPDMLEEQADQWALLRHEIEEEPQQPIERERSTWDQRNTEGDAISVQSPFAPGSLEPSTHHVDIVVVGVGGGGMNAINQMMNTNVRGVRFVAMNTDAQVLALSKVPDRICLGQHHTRGLGAGGNAAIGMRAATESAAEIRAALGDADLVFIAAGMGGGTGTGAAPVVASIAKKMGALTVGIVTLPFTFEGTRRRRSAEQGLEELRAEIDALITVPNDRLLGTMARERNLTEAFKVADDVLRQGVQGIAEVINVPGMINVDFADVRSVLRNAGTALMSIGEGSGSSRAQQAAEAAIAGGFLNVTIQGAKKVLFNISGGEDMTLFEVNEVAERIGEAIDDAAEIIFGAVIDPTLQDTLRVTLIAAGMEDFHTTRIENHRTEQLQNRRFSPARPVPVSGTQNDGPHHPAPRTLPPIRSNSPLEPPQTQMPPSLPSSTASQRQQRSLDDLRGLRSMARRQELRRYHLQRENDNTVEPPPFLKRPEAE